MDYEHLYLYLDNRPLEELRDCMLSVINLVRNKLGSGGGLATDSFLFTTEEDLIMNPGEALLRLRQLQTMLGKAYTSASTNTESEVGVESCTVSTSTDKVEHCTVATSTELIQEAVCHSISTNTDIVDIIHHTVATNTDIVQQETSESEIKSEDTVVIGRKRPRAPAEPSKLVWTTKMVRTTYYSYCFTAHHALIAFFIYLIVHKRM